MANRWRKVEAVTDFIFLGSEITADGDCSHEIKRHLLLGRKIMTNLDSILKTRDITLLTKVYLVKAMVFPGVMYRHERSTIKKADHWIIYTFKLVLEKTLENPLDCKETKLANPKGNQPWIHWKDCCWSWSSNPCHLMWRANSLEKTWFLERLKAGGEGGDRGRDGYIASLTQWTWVWAISRC